MKNQSNKKGAKKKAAAAAAGIVAACSLAVASAAPSAAELFNGAEQTPAAQFAASSSDRRVRRPAPPTFAARLRARFLSAPSVLRGVVLLPFWAAGKTLIALFSLLGTALAPVWQILLGVLLNALLLFGLFALVYKLLFPNKKLRELLTKRNILLLAGGSLLLAAADAVLRTFWEDYRPVSIAVKLILALGVLILLSWRIFGRRRSQKSRRKKSSVHKTRHAAGFVSWFNYFLNGIASSSASTCSGGVAQEVQKRTASLASSTACQ